MSSSSSRPSRPVTKETDEERARRRAEKAAKVGAHRADVLRRLNTKRTLSTLHKADTFVAPVRFENRLPEVPVEQRYIAYPFDEDLVYALDVTQAVSTDAGPRVFNAEPDVGVGLALGLLDPAAYTLVPGGSAAPKHPADVAICSADYAAPATQARAVIADTERIEWLMRSQLLHSDLYDSVYKHNDAIGAATKELEKERVDFERARMARPRASRIAAAFSAAARIDSAASSNDLRHPLTPALTARRVWTLLPEADAPGQALVEVTFDREPEGDSGLATASRSLKRARLSRGLIRTAASQAVDMRTRSTTVHLLLPEPARGGGAAAELLAPEGEYTLEYSEPSKGEQHFALLWHAASGVVNFTPVLSKASLVRVSRADVGSDAAAFAAVTRRALTEAEEDDVADARARACDADAAPALTLVANRRAKRASTARAEAERNAAAAAAAASAKAAAEGAELYAKANEAADAAASSGRGGALTSGVDDDLFDDEE
jgi:hypothetical protein